MMEVGLKHHVVELEVVGPVSVFVQGDWNDYQVVFLTVHDVGSTYQTWANFTSHPSMEEIKKRSLFLHICLPGQEPGAVDLSPDYKFPTMQELGVNLITIIDQFRIPRVVGLGDGAGGNIITRFGMMHPSRVHGIVAVNNTATPITSRFMERLKERLSALKRDEETSLNEKNVAKFAEAYKKRTALLPQLNDRINFDVLLLAGMKSKYVGDTEAIHREMTPGLCSMIKVDDVVDPLAETPDKVAEAVLLFCQGMSLIPTVGSRRLSENLTGEELANRKMSMEEYDKPNIRRLSLTALEIH